MKDRKNNWPSADQMAKEIIAECEKNNMDYHETINRIYIKSPTFSDWYIDLNPEAPKLFHENYRKIRNYKNGRGFHEHKIKEGYTMTDVVKYIHAHDKKMLYKIA